MHYTMRHPKVFTCLNMCYHVFILFELSLSPSLSLSHYILSIKFVDLSPIWVLLWAFPIAFWALKVSGGRCWGLLWHWAAPPPNGGECYGFMPISCWKSGFMPAAPPELSWHPKFNMGGICWLGAIWCSQLFARFVEWLLVLMHFHTSSVATLSLQYRSVLSTSRFDL